MIRYVWIRSEQMTDKERFLTIMNFEKPDRMLAWEQGFWGGTIERWYREGLPEKEGVTGNPAYGDTVRGPATPVAPGDKTCPDIYAAADLDKPSWKVPVNLYLYPEFDEEVIEEEDDRRVIRDEYGIVKRISDKKDSIPYFLSWPVKSMEDFEALAEERLDPNTPGRFPDDWERQVERLNSYDGVVAIGGYPCGFFGAPRYLMGEVALLIGFLDSPELVHRIIDHLADLWTAVYDRVLSRINVDCIHIWEDMSFKNGPLISPELFAEFLVPAYKRVTDVARSHGVNVVLVDTDGDCTKLIPGFLEGGVTGLYPFEVQAGMDVKAVREAFPGLQILGGINKREIAKGRESIDRELEKRIPGMVKTGGYIPMFDHQVPPDVSWEDYLYYRQRVREMSEADAHL
jgi:uroporphyrinogen decarboxylase